MIKRTRKQPEWDEDELVLIMDLYFKRRRKKLVPTDPDVKSLSESFKRMRHIENQKYSNLRSPKAVYSKLMESRGIQAKHPV